ncbi:MAG: hypothetical protein GY832_28530 [Chloroflexi bacterium]|nr:hypothetical protein [Chloroflexota bacterium]
MENQPVSTVEIPVSSASVSPETIEPSPAELRARRMLTIGLVVAGLFLVSVLVLLVFLSIDAYQAAAAGQGPSPGEIVVGLFRDAAIIFVAFETLLIGVLLIILMIQMQSLVMLLRDEIKPMLESANETLATVRGTTQFVSHNVVSPVVKWSGYMAGLRRIVQEIRGLDGSEEKEN